jgi:hypothetical protein
MTDCYEKFVVGASYAPLIRKNGGRSPPYNFSGFAGGPTAHEDLF